MFKSNPLCSFKSLFPPINQPLPLNKRESQRLLESLTVSFRRQLDKEHGWLPEETSSSPIQSPKLSYLPTDNAARSTEDSHRRPTDRHVSAILSNPLFSYQSTLSPTNSNTRTNRDPMEVFDEAVAKGMMTIKRAHGCMVAIRKELLQSSSMSLRDGMRVSGAGLRVAQWLRASGMERDLSFLKHEHFVNLLVQFLTAEGLEELPWTWLAHLIKGEGPADLSSAMSQPISTFILFSLVHAHVLIGKNLDGGYASILRGEDLQKNNPSHPFSLVRAWRSLSWSSTVNAWKYPTPSEQLFERYIVISDRIHQNTQVDRAHLELHHPTKASSSQAVSLFLTDDNKAIPSWRRLTDPRHCRLAVRLMSLGLDTVRHLTRQGQSEEAQRILDIVRREIEPLFPQRGPRIVF